MALLARVAIPVREDRQRRGHLPSGERTNNGCHRGQRGSFQKVSLLDTGIYDDAPFHVGKMIHAEIRKAAWSCKPVRPRAVAGYLHRIKRLIAGCHGMRNVILVD